MICNLIQIYCENRTNFDFLIEEKIKMITKYFNNNKLLYFHLLHVTLNLKKTSKKR